VSSVLSNTESPHTQGMVLGDTGDHHFPKSSVNSERNYTDVQANGKDMLLSEIAEEDSMSMISDKNLGHGRSRTNGKTEKQSTRS
jgi:hypothetical protein